MKIVPQGSPQSSQPQHSQGAQSPRDKAIAAFNAAPTQHSVNQNAISPEELSAVRPPQEASEAMPLPTPQVSTPSTESQPDPIKEETALSDRYAHLARQQKALRQKQLQQDQAYKTREDAIKAKEAEYAAKDQEYQKGYISKDRLKQQTLQTLLENGVTYEELTQQVLQQQPQDPRVSAELERLKEQNLRLESKLTEWEQNTTKQQQQAYQSAIKQIQADTKALVSTDPNFEMIKATGSIQDVVELITKTYEQDQILLSVEEAAQQVEDYLADEAIKLANLTKIKKKLAPVAPEQTSSTPMQTQQGQKQQTQPVKTLTNAISSPRPMTTRERAIAAFHGKLTS